MAVETKWTLAQTVPATILPVTVDEAKKALRLASSDPTHDEELTRHIGAATSQFQEDTDRAVLTSTFVQSWHAFPRDDVPLDLMVKPVQQVDDITYYDVDGVQQTIDPVEYIFNAADRSLALAPGGSWPTTDQRYFGVEVKYTCGYGDTADLVDPSIKQAIICLVAGFFYGNAPDAEPYMQCYQRLLQPKLRTSYF